MEINIKPKNIYPFNPNQAFLTIKLPVKDKILESINPSSLE